MSVENKTGKTGRFDFNNRKELQDDYKSLHENDISNANKNQNTIDNLKKLQKSKKRSISLTLSMENIKKIDELHNKLNISRSELVDYIIKHFDIEL